MKLRCKFVKWFIRRVNHLYNFEWWYKNITDIQINCVSRTDRIQSYHYLSSQLKLIARKLSDDFSTNQLPCSVLINMEKTEYCELIVRTPLTYRILFIFSSINVLHISIQSVIHMDNCFVYIFWDNYLRTVKFEIVFM